MTTIVTTPGTGKCNRVKEISVKNISGTTNTVYFRKNNGTNEYLISNIFTIAVGESIVYNRSVGWYQLDVNGNVYGTTVDNLLYTTTILIDQAAWVLDGSYYVYTHSDIEITEDSHVTIIPDKADVDIVLAAVIMPDTLVADGQVTIYATNEPTADINAELKVIKTGGDAVSTIVNGYYPEGW